jgi:beta-N-acetylhexosaminidase
VPEIRDRLRPLLLLLVACSVVVTSLGGPAAASSSDRIDQIINRMTLQEKVGQLFVTYAYGQTADTTVPADVAHNEQELGVANGKELIEKYHVGGVIYFAWSNNVANPEQIAGLSNGLQRVATSQGSGIPLMISTDQEQGVVTRVGPPATQLPGNMALGAGRSVPNAYDAAQISGKELRAIGINQNFAPVSDVNVNAQNPVIGVRSFGSDPSLVSDLVSASVDGFQSANVAALPGSRRHGDRQPLRRADHQPHPRPVGQHRRPAVPGRDQPRHRHDHDGAHRRPRARPVRGAGHPLEADHHRHPAG